MLGGSSGVVSEFVIDEKFSEFHQMSHEGLLLGKERMSESPGLGQRRYSDSGWCLRKFSLGPSRVLE